MGDAVGIGMETGAAIMNGRQQRNAYKMEVAQLETQKKQIETNAALAQAERMRKLETVLAAQNAVFAIGGQTAGAGTAGAIQAASISEANRESRIQNLEEDMAKKSADYNIWSAQKAARLSMATSMLNFGVDFYSRNHATAAKFVTNMLKKKFSGGMGGMGGMGSGAGGGGAGGGGG